MSSLSKYRGAGTIIGQSIPMVGALHYFMDGTAEYLRSGFLKAYTATYATYAARLPSGCLVDVANYNAFNANLAGDATNYNPGVYWNGTHYVALNSGNLTAPAARYSANLTAWSSAGVSGSATASYGHAQLGTTVLLSGRDPTLAPMQYLTAGLTTFSQATGIAAGVALTSVAANAAGTLAVALVTGSNTAASGIYTSTNGTAWTARTGSGGTAIAAVGGVHWSPCAAAFLIVGDSTAACVINKTTDGFTQTASLNDTSVGMPSGAFVVAPQQYMASSPTVTLVACNDMVLKRTTDGTTWTTIDLKAVVGSLLLVTGTYGAPRIYWNSVHSKFVAQLSTASGATYYLTSADGITWVPSFLFRDATAGSNRYLVGLYVANGKCLAHSIVSNTSYGVHDITSALAKTVPDWVGTAQATFNSGLPTYARIA